MVCDFGLDDECDDDDCDDNECTERREGIDDDTDRLDDTARWEEDTEDGGEGDGNGVCSYL